MSNPSPQHTLMLSTPEKSLYIYPYVTNKYPKVTVTHPYVTHKYPWATVTCPFTM